MNSSTTTTTQSSETVTLVVTEIIEDNLCIESEKAKKVYEQTAAAFKEGKKVILDFKNGEDYTWGFFSEAIGQLYVHFPEEQIRASLSFVNIEPDDVDFIEDVIYWKKEYIANPERFKEATREFLGDDDDE